MIVSIKLGRLLAKNLDLIVIFALGLVPLTWLKPGWTIAFGDFRPPINASWALESRTSVWNSIENLGYNNSAQVAWIVPFLTFFYLMAKLGASLALSESIWMVLWFTIPGLSMRYLCRKLNLGITARLLSSAFYMYNPFRLYYFPQNELDYLFYSVMPLFLAFLISAVYNRKAILRSSLYFGLTSFAISTAFANPRWALILTLMVVISLLYFTVVAKLSVGSSLKLISVFAIVTLLLNAWWIMPYSYLILNLGARQDVVAALGEYYGRLAPASRCASIIETFRLLGESLLYASGCGGLTWYGWSDWFTNNPMVTKLSFVLPIICFSTLLNRKNTGHKGLFAVLGLFGIFFATGTNHFGASGLYAWLYTYLPPFRAFVHPLQSFVPFVALSYSAMLGFAVQSFNKFIGARSDSSSHYGLGLSKIAALSLLGLIVVSSASYTYPPISGEVLEGGPSRAKVYLPGYYLQQSSLSTLNDSYKVLLLPLPVSDHPRFLLGNSTYYGWDFVDELLRMPVVDNARIGNPYSLNLTKEALTLLNLEDYQNYTIFKRAVNLPSLFTITLWVYPESYSIYGVGTILRLDTNGLPTILHLYRTVNGMLVLDYYATDRNIDRLYIGSLLHPYTWNFIVFRYNGTALEADINGQRSSVTNFVLKSGMVNLSLGSSVSGTFIGSIRDFRLYDRYLSDELVKAVAEGDVLDFKAQVVYFDKHPAVFPSNANYSGFKLLALIGVRYIAIRERDITSTPYRMPSALIDYYISKGILEELGSVGDLTVYQISYESMPMVYTTNNMTIVQSNFVDTLSQISLLSRPVIVTVNDQSGIQAFIKLSNLTKLTRIFDTRIVNYLPYSITASVNSSGPFFLVLSQSFDNGWKLLIDGQEDALHFVANGYANGWYVNKTGNITIHLYYYPQNYFFLGILTSTVSFGLLMVVSFGKPRMRVFRRKGTPY